MNEPIDKPDDSPDVRGQGASGADAARGAEAGASRRRGEGSPSGEGRTVHPSGATPAGGHQAGTRPTAAKPMAANPVGVNPPGLARAGVNPAGAAQGSAEEAGASSPAKDAEPTAATVPPPDITDGWPDEPENEQLAALAQDVFRQRSQLSPQAMSRVRAAMHREMELRRGGRVSAGGFGPGNTFPRWFHLGTLLALLIFLLALGFGSVVLFRQMSQKPHPTAPANPPENADTPVRDTYTVHGLPGQASGSATDIIPTPDPQALRQEMACWTMMPVKPAQLAAFRARIDELAVGNPRSEWLAVFRLYAMVLSQDDAVPADQTPAAVSAPDLVTAAAAVTPPAQFPTTAADAQLFRTLRDQFLNDNSAALEVIGQRSWVALTGLSDLDARLTRAAGQAGAEDARKLLACRDRLRDGYLAVARHVRQRTFALRLLGRYAQAKALEDRCDNIPALAGAQPLHETLDALEPKAAWEQVLRPLLTGDLALLDPPAHPEIPATAATEPMTVSAATKILQGTDLAYRGDVAVALGDLRMHCDRLSVTTDAAGSHLNGQGNVAVNGLPGFPDAITAATFTFDTGPAVFSFAGDVHLSPARIVPACTITRSGVMFTQPSPATKAIK